MLGGIPVIYGIDPHSQEEVPQHQLGAIGFTTDGRRFRYAKAGAALTAGDLLQSPAEVTAQESLAPAAAAALGATSISVTTGGTVTSNAYADGYAVITNTPGNGIYYKIKSNEAVTGATTMVIKLYDPITVALTTAASKIDLVFNPFAGVIQNPATPTGCPVGVAPRAFTSGYYGWIQDKGSCSVLAGGNITVGRQVVADLGVAATVVVAANATTEVYPVVGYAQTTVATGENATIFLNIG